MTITEWIIGASRQLKAVAIETSRLDVEVILAHTLVKPRTYLHAHGEDEIPAKLADIADARLQLRLEHVPIAYIIGHKEFYGRRFHVNPSVLIPRPESEVIIELLKKHLSSKTQSLLDIGTGSGCLGITTKLEFPNLDVTLCDISESALITAAENADSLRVELKILHSDLLKSIHGTFDCIIANLPYVDKSWQRSPETDFEPGLALFANDDGLDLINHLLQQAPSSLNQNGLIMLEADPCQHHRISAIADSFGFKQIDSEDYILVFQKL
ncbi:MAG: peptide chain release factor N(5)-glutamine methyltransferase [Candidatus Saccharimonas sp.]